MNSIPDHRKNNFDFIRLIAAWMVLFSHSYILYGRGNQEPLGLYSGFMEFGTLGVFIFFIISGYLITESFLRDTNTKVFFIKRFFRIVPGLWVVLVICATLLGPAISSLSPTAYFKDPLLTRYLFGMWFYKLTFTLPQVFTANPYPNIINGSLWSIPLEFTMYILVFIFGRLNFLNKKNLILINLILIGLWLFLPQKQLAEYLFDMNKGELLKCGIMFFMGALLNIFDFKKRIQHLNTNKMLHLLMILLLVITVFSLASAIGLTLLFFTLPPLVLYFAFSKGLHSIVSKVPPLSWLLKKGDFSYGIYLYAFPIQQTLIYIYKNEITFFTFVVCSTLVTLLFGVLSWSFVESPMIKMGRKLIEKSTSIG